MSRCFCSICTFSLVASLYFLSVKFRVTSFHSFRLSYGSCLSIGRTVLGIDLSTARSISVAYSFWAEGIVFGKTADAVSRARCARDPAGDDAVDHPVPTFLHLTLPRQDPSKTATTRAVGTCFTLVQSSWCVSPSKTVWITPSSKKWGLPNHDWTRSVRCCGQRRVKSRRLPLPCTR